MITLIAGVPGLLVSCCGLALMLPWRSRKAVRAAASVLFAATVAFGLYVAGDAITLFRRIGSENALIGLAFFFLLAVACALFWGIVRKPRLPA